MKYIIIGKNPNGALEWNGCDSPEKAAEFIKIHYKDVLEKCGYDWKLVHREIIVLMVTDYQFAAINVEPPTETKVEVSRWRNIHGNV